MHEATLNAVVAFCQGKDINNVAEIAKNPEAIAQIINIFKTGMSETQRQFDEAVRELTVEELLADDSADQEFAAQFTADQSK